MNREQLLAEFLGLSKRLSSLDFAKADQLEELESIQSRQADIRMQFDQLPAEGREPITSQMRAIVAEIRNLELKNMDRMLKFKAELEQTRNNIQSAKRVKNVYENAYIQGFGYFVDSHK